MVPAAVSRKSKSLWEPFQRFTFGSEGRVALFFCLYVLGSQQWYHGSVSPLGALPALHLRVGGDGGTFFLLCMS